MKTITKPLWYPRTATDKDLGRKDRRLALTEHETLTCCEDCEEPITFRRNGDDTDAFCVSCQTVFPKTFTVAPGDCDCSMGADGATPSLCRACSVRREWL